MQYAARRCSWPCYPRCGSLSGQTQSTGQLMVISACSESDARSQMRRSKAHDDNFVIGNDDVLAISVWKEPELTKSVPVRSDGKISLPLVGEMEAPGIPRSVGTADYRQAEELHHYARSDGHCGEGQQQEI